MTMLLLAWQREDAALPNDDSPNRGLNAGPTELTCATATTLAAIIERDKQGPGL